ncbi:MAG: hypothetical protein IJZ94_05290 [Clostridia bacterium]|nr:hypothetical protein [Clostridia bacterium]
MAGGFQNKYYFLNETEHSGGKLCKGAPGYISFWENTGILKVNLLIENILKQNKVFEAYLQGGTKLLKIAEFMLNKKGKNGTWSAVLNFKIKLDDGLQLKDFDTVLIKFKSAENDEPLFDVHSSVPCDEVKENKEKDRIEEAKQLETPETVFKDLKAFDPFNTTNHAYKWWICESYTRICDTLHKMDIHLPGYVSKTLYTNMQFFKHAILGKYTSVENRCFVIVGIPVQNLPPANSPQSPARPMVCRRFINNSGYRGYLLFYIDYASTAMVKAVVV